MTKLRLPYCATLLLAVGISGCGSETEDLEAYVADVKSRKSRAIEPIPQMQQFESFVYDPAGRRDPFVLPSQQRDASGFSANPGLRPDLNRNKEALEEFPLDSLRMVGTILLGNRTYALIKAPDGVIHRVSAGNHMGQNYGEITAIAETEITLNEIIPDGFGGWMNRAAQLALAQ